MTKFRNYDLPGQLPVLSWNPIVMRCPGCELSKPDANGWIPCWHIRMCNRMMHNPTIPAEHREIYAGRAPMRMHPKHADEPLGVRKSRVICAQFMGDLGRATPECRAEGRRQVNHDISIGEMLDDSEDLKGALLGRDPEIQFVRLASAYNALRGELDAANQHVKIINEASAAVGASSVGVRMIAAERKRQVTEEGWTTEHDAQHFNGELAQAARSYARPNATAGDAMEPPAEWPWDWSWWKPSDDVVRNLVKAGALIAAEIDRRKKLGKPT